MGTLFDHIILLYYNLYISLNERKSIVWINNNWWCRSCGGLRNESDLIRLLVCIHNSTKARYLKIGDDTDLYPWDEEMGYYYGCVNESEI